MKRTNVNPMGKGLNMYVVIGLISILSHELDDLYFLFTLIPEFDNQFFFFKLEKYENLMTWYFKIILRCYLKNLFSNDDMI